MASFGQDTSKVSHLLVLQLGGSGFVVELDHDRDTHHYFDRPWKYLFTLVGI